MNTPVYPPGTPASGCQTIDLRIVEKLPETDGTGGWASASAVPATGFWEG